MMIEDDCKAATVRPWPCRNCCHFTEAVPEAMRENYVGCRWWLDACNVPPASVHQIPQRSLGYLTRKQVFGPHEGEPIVCKVFEAEQNKSLTDGIREAIRLAEQPHYGDTDTALEHCGDALELLRKLIEKET